MKFVTSTSQHQADSAPEKKPEPLAADAAPPRIIQMRSVESEECVKGAPMNFKPEACASGEEYARVDLTPQATAFIYKMLQSPNELPDKPYAAPSTKAAKELIALNEWFMGPDGKGNPKLITVETLVVQGTPGRKWETKASSVEIKRKYVDRLKDMCSFHKDAGMLVHNCRGYQELVAGLRGQASSPDTDVER